MEGITREESKSSLDVGVGGVENVVVPVIDLNIDPVESAALMSLTSMPNMDESEVLQYRDLYLSLFEKAKASVSSEKHLMKHVRVTKKAVLQECILVEKYKIGHQDNSCQIDRLKEDLEEAQKLHDQAERADCIVDYEYQRVVSLNEETKNKVNNLKDANDAVVSPELGRLRSTLREMADECEEAVRQREKDEGRVMELSKLYSSLQEEERENEAIMSEKRESHVKNEHYCKQLKRNCHVLGQAVETLKSQVHNMFNKVNRREAEIAGQKQKQREADDIERNLTHKLELHRETMEQRQQQVDSIATTLDMRKTYYHTLTATRLELEMTSKQMDGDVRHHNARAVLERKHFEIEKRALLRKKQIATSTKDIVDNLKTKLEESRNILTSYRAETDERAKMVNQMKNSVDLGIVRVLKRENVQKKLRDDLEQIIETVHQREHHIQIWRTEETKLLKMHAIVEMQREVKEREAIRTAQHANDTTEKTHLKQLELLDLQTKIHDTIRAINEFRALHDLIRKERDRLIHTNQTCAKAFHQINHKSNTLNQEFETLKHTLHHKQNTLQKQQYTHEAKRAKRATLRSQISKLRATFNDKNQQKDRQHVQIDKLNAALTALRRELTRLTQKTHAIDQSKAFVADQVDDRKTEFCKLLMKANFYEQTLKKGEIDMQKREEECHILNLQQNELRRQIDVIQKQLAQMPQFTDKIDKLNTQLQAEQNITKDLCQKLEDPKEQLRQYTNADASDRQSGADPDEEHLTAKINVLEQMLSNNKENLLEKNLVLEELTNLTDRLRTSAKQTQLKTRPIIQKVNDYKSKVRDVNRSTMAIVSELSMYQATAIKLEEEKQLQEDILRDAVDKVEQGQPPTDEAAKELTRIEYDHNASMINTSSSSFITEGQFYPCANALRTTALPRPTAYIPEDDMGIPKPYGAMPPFKPTDAGSTMRHIRQPLPQKIQL